MITYSQSIFFLKFLANRVRKYAKEFELNEAVKLAVDECIRNNILSEFLRKNKAEVIAMSIFEYDKEEEEKKIMLIFINENAALCNLLIIKM